jgi:hypothetical protein
MRQKLIMIAVALVVIGAAEGKAACTSLTRCRFLHLGV